MAKVATLAQTDDHYWSSSRQRLQRSSDDLKVILGRERGPDVMSLTESSCRLLESTRPFSNLRYNKMHFTQTRSTKKGLPDKPKKPTARVGWRLPVWLDALSLLESNDQEMQAEALQQLAAGPPKAAKWNHRKTQEHPRPRPKHYQTLAFLGDIGLSDVFMESLNNNDQESRGNLASKVHAGYASLSGDFTRSRAGVPEWPSIAEVDESTQGHVTLNNMQSLDKSGSYATARPNKMRVGGVAAWFVSQSNSFRAKSREPVVSDPKSFLDCGYLRLKPGTVLDLEELCRKQGIDPRPHRHMTSEQLLEYYAQLKERPSTPDDMGEEVLGIWSRVH